MTVGIIGISLGTSVNTPISCETNFILPWWYKLTQPLLSIYIYLSGSQNETAEINVQHNNSVILTGTVKGGTNVISPYQGEGNYIIQINNNQVCSFVITFENPPPLCSGPNVCYGNIQGNTIEFTESIRNLELRTIETKLGDGETTWKNQQQVTPGQIQPFTFNYGCVTKNIDANFFVESTLFSDTATICAANLSLKDSHIDNPGFYIHNVTLTNIQGTTQIRRNSNVNTTLPFTLNITLENRTCYDINGWVFLNREKNWVPLFNSQEISIPSKEIVTVNLVVDEYSGTKNGVPFPNNAETLPFTSMPLKLFFLSANEQMSDDFSFTVNKTMSLRALYLPNLLSPLSIINQIIDGKTITPSSSVTLRGQKSYQVSITARNNLNVPINATIVSYVSASLLPGSGIISMPPSISITFQPNESIVVPVGSLTLASASAGVVNTLIFNSLTSGYPFDNLQGTTIYDGALTRIRLDALPLSNEIPSGALLNYVC